LHPAEAKLVARGCVPGDTEIARAKRECDGAPTPDRVRQAAITLAGSPGLPISYSAPQDTNAPERLDTSTPL